MKILFQTLMITTIGYGLYKIGVLVGVIETTKAFDNVSDNKIEWERIDVGMFNDNVNIKLK